MGFFSHTNPYISNVMQQCRCSPMLKFRVWATRVFISSFSILRLICNLSLPFVVRRMNVTHRSIDDQLEMAALHVRWLAASFFSNRPRRFWITWNHLSNCRGLRPIEPDRGVGSRKSEVRSGKWEAGGSKSNHAALSLSGKKSEIRSSNFVKSEVWSLKYEVGSRA